MSEQEIFIYVEGWTDRGFYSQLCEAVFSGSGSSYQIRTADEILGDSGGKQKLISLYNQLAANGGLTETFQGKKSRFVFILDKDLDDLARTMINSLHVIYTKHYHMENYPLRHCDFVRLLCSVGNLTAAQARQIGPNADTWCRAVAVRWKHWVELCVQSTLDGVNCRCRYRSPSQVNHDDGRLNEAALEQCRRELATRSGLTPADCATRRQEIERVISELYEQDRQDAVFRGRWYAECLANTLSPLVAPRLRHGLRERLFAAAMTGLDFKDEWAAHLRSDLQLAADLD